MLTDGGLGLVAKYDGAETWLSLATTGTVSEAAVLVVPAMPVTEAQLPDANDCGNDDASHANGRITDAGKAAATAFAVRNEKGEAGTDGGDTTSAVEDNPDPEPQVTPFMLGRALCKPTTEADMGGGEAEAAAGGNENENGGNAEEGADAGENVAVGASRN